MSLPQSLQNVILPTLAEIENEIARRSAVAFAKACGLDDPDPWQQDVLKWDGDKLDLNCARQSGKSTIASIYGLRKATIYEKQLILLVSPSQRQSGELFKKVREFIREMPDGLKPKLTEDNRLSCTLENGSRIVALPGEEKTIRGYSGANLIICDEDARISEALYMSIKPMLAVSKGKLMLMSTPFGQQGHFYDVWNNNDPDWTKIKVTAYDNPRITDAFLEKEKKEMGDWWFDQEYMCIFREDVDSIFTSELIQRAMDDSIKPLYEVVQ